MLSSADQTKTKVGNDVVAYTVFDGTADRNTSIGGCRYCLGWHKDGEQNGNQSANHHRLIGG